MMKLLFIEDDPSAVEPVMNLIKREQADMQYEVSGFDGAEDKIASFRPDIVILDLLIGGASPEPEPEGLKARDFIWDQHFCPLVVYSAEPDIYNDKYEPHPFVKSIKKGKGSPRKVLKALGELRPQVEALHGAEEHILQSFALALREVAPDAFRFFDDTDRHNNVILRAGRRRLAALMDDMTAPGDRLASWEQYLSPPIGPNIKLGDILMKVDGGYSDPTSFRVVLTPSCDLVASDGRTPKVDNVLVARCCPMREGLDLTSLKGRSLAKLKKLLPGTVLSHGYFEAVIPFPCLKGRIPTMAADMRNMEFIPVNDISISDAEFLRIASLDSPFRELVAWAYLQIACRPGLPDRDLDSWRDEIVALLKG
ncbi:MAG: response regulator [Planctomycetes bacterium]|nr:response regulator [Planctomycetota bacterium]